MVTALTEDPGDASGSLRVAKLSLPKEGGLLVPRRRLFDRVTEGVAGPVTVVYGPAGSGKTTLVASWIAHDLATGPVAWVTLDPADNQPGIFWTYVVEALRRHGVDLPPSVGHPVRPDAVDRSFLEDLAAALASSTQTVVLVLDQFEAVTNSQMLRDLDFVLRNAAPELRLVLTTRRQPAGAFSRYVLSGRVVQIHADDLAFRTDEAAALLAQHEITLPADTLRELQGHLEGWASGLRLCALALQSGDDPAELIARLPSGHAQIAGHLVDDVLDRQPKPVRRQSLS